MGLFKSNRSFPYTPPSLAAVAEAVMQEFRGQGYEATGHELAGGSHFISLTKGDTFKAVLGLKTALNVTMTPAPGGTNVEARIGTYGEAIIGAAVAAFVFWPLILTQVAGVIETSKLDDRAMAAIEKSLRAHSAGTASTAAPARSAAGEPSPGPEADAARATAALFCTECGTPLPAGAKFCLQCGTKVATA